MAGLDPTDRHTWSAKALIGQPTADRRLSPLRYAASLARPAPEMGDHNGRSPGSRVVAWPSLPIAHTTVASVGFARRLQLRGQPQLCTAFPFNLMP